MHRRRFLAAEKLGPGPGAAAPVQPVSGFMVCPVALHPGWLGWHEVYRVALERAQAVLRPSRWERWMKPVWN
ncbi:MAG TPA: hypothetical protein VFE78_28835 [Gemmataceae bacterium]|jgi:hypothetical protein|nr:hypothetical protein [Gemmataceae bacterium]